ncbi:MAG TPA: hypothetical protein V6D22_04530 [Candidatus Obscuribacterales bacterium]
MIAIHPFLRAIPCGILALFVCAPLGFPNVCLAALAVLIFFGFELSKEQQAYEEKLLHRKRLYNCDIEQVFAGLQRALSNAWLNESHWQNRITELTSGYLLYRYEWREPESSFDDGRTRHHANLQIECVDCSDLEGAKTVVTFSFDGLPNEWIKRTFYDAVQLAMGAIDAYLPDHTVLKPEFEGNDASNTGFIDHEMQGS